MITSKYEEALIAISRAVNSRGLKIMLMPGLTYAPMPPQAFVDRINQLTDGHPVNMESGLGGSDEYRNVAENVILLATALRECVSHQDFGVMGCAEASKPLYQRLPTDCDLSMTGLEECAIRMKAAASYKLYVNHKLFPYAAMLVKHMGAETRDHPFAPYINIVSLDKLKRDEWFIEGDAFEAWGSPGVS